MSEATENAETNHAGDESSDLVIVDLSKPQSRKRVKKLRKGRGKLLGKIEDMLHEMRENGAIERDAQPVVIIVREEDETAALRRRLGW